MIITGTRVRGGRYYGGTATAGDTYFNLVSLLLPGNGTNGAQNNTFLDSSSNALTVTRNGNTTQGTFSPFSQTGWSVYFGGTNYLTSSYNIAFAPESGDFTVECWVYFTASPTGTDQGFVGNINMSSGDGDWLLFWRGSLSRWEFSATSNGSVGTIQRSYNTTTPSAGQWYHVVGVKNGSTLSCYVNGVKGTDGTLATVNNGSSTLNIGQGASNTGRVTGNISNLRITKGGALYSGSTFTPPTAPLTTTVSTGTVSLLTCQSNRFIDNSTNAFALVTSGAAVQAFSPFNPTTAYAAGTVGGSGYFDGNGDYLDAGAQTAFAFGTGSWTVEAWVYVTSLSSEILLFDTRSSVSTAGVGCRIATDGTLSYSGSANNPLTSTAIKTNEWNHIAWSYDGTTLSGYINGVRGGTATPSFNISQNNGIVGRVGFSATAYMSGYISSLRVVKGSAVYSGTSFSLPTAPLTAISGTSLLLSGTNGGITDATAKGVFETVGSAQISTAQSKFGGSSMAFDGNGDYLQMTSPSRLLINWWTQDFTIEGWIYPTTLTNTSYAQGGNQTPTLIGNMSPSTDGNYWSFGPITNGTLRLYYYNGSSIFAATSTETVTINQWNHIALTNVAGVGFKYWVNGIGSSNITVSGTPLSGSELPLMIGWKYYSTGSAGFTGYIDDVRITTGLARYTTNFTPPTAAFPTQ